jgi:TRAP-type C4-dicarboxylate transport system substrate-binding protein
MKAVAVPSIAENWIGRLVMVAALLVPGLLCAQELRIATQTPKSSTWARVLEDAGLRCSVAMKGRVTLRFSYTRSQGDDVAALRKIQQSQIDGAIAGTSGLSLVCAEVRVMKLPWLFTSNLHAGSVRDKVAPVLNKAFGTAGVVVAWIGIGPVHLYSFAPFKSTLLKHRYIFEATSHIQKSPRPHEYRHV